MLKALDNTEWKEVFYFCEAPKVVPSMAKVSCDLFSRGDVVEVIAMVGGMNGGGDQGEWMGVFELRDGRFLFVSASHDSTGYERAKPSISVVAGSVEDLMRSSIKVIDQERLGLVLKSDPPWVNEISPVFHTPKELEEKKLPHIVYGLTHGGLMRYEVTWWPEGDFLVVESASGEVMSYIVTPENLVIHMDSLWLTLEDFRAGRELKVVLLEEDFDGN